MCTYSNRSRRSKNGRKSMGFKKGENIVLFTCSFFFFLFFLLLLSFFCSFIFRSNHSGFFVGAAHVARRVDAEMGRRTICERTRRAPRSRQAEPRRNQSASQKTVEKSDQHRENWRASGRVSGFIEIVEEQGAQFDGPNQAIGKRHDQTGDSKRRQGMWKKFGLYIFTEKYRGEVGNERRREIRRIVAPCFSN